MGKRPGLLVQARHDRLVVFCSICICSSPTKIGTKRFRLDFLYPCTPQRLWKLLMDERKDWDDSIESFRKVSDLSHLHQGAFVSHIATGSVGIISSREFVDINHTEVDPATGVLLSFGQSVKPPASWAANPKCVLGMNFPGCGWRLTPCAHDGSAVGLGSSEESEAPSCRIQYVIHTELSGWLPAMAVNAGMTSTLVAFIKASLAHLNAAS